MARMKLLFASFATGILITAGVFITVLFVRAFFKDDASVTFALWFFGWPISFMRLLPGVSVNALIWLSFAIGILLDMVFISFVTYGVLRAIVSRQKRTRPAIPPQPPTF